MLQKHNYVPKAEHKGYINLFLFQYDVSYFKGKNVLSTMIDASFGCFYFQKIPSPIQNNNLDYLFLTVKVNCIYLHI